MTESQPFLRGYRVLFIPILNAAGESAWPELFPIDKIDTLRDTVGPRHFAAQMMLEHISEDRAVLPPEALQFYEHEFDPRRAAIEQNPITGASCYWDPSSARGGADGSVVVMLYRDDKNRRAFIHDVKYLRVTDGDMHPFKSQCERVLDFLRRHDARHISIETNGIGNALPEILRERAMARGMGITIRRVINKENKERRILDAIEPFLSTGRLHAHIRVGKTKFMTEMEDWTPGATLNHDDGLDAVAGALRAQPIAVRPRGQMTLPFQATTDFKI